MKLVNGKSTMANRVTINKVNARISKYGFEIVRGNGYYYFSRLTDKSPNITEDGIYGTPFLNAWTIDQLESMLVERIIQSAPYESESMFILRAVSYTETKMLDNK